MKRIIHGFIKNLISRLVICILMISQSDQSGFAQSPINNDSGKIIINLNYRQYKPGDSIRLNMMDVFSYEKSGVTFYPKPNGDKSLRFEIPIKQKSGYFSILTKRTTSGPGDMSIVADQFWELGDSITLTVSHRESNAGIYSNCQFSGRGANKYILMDKMSRIRMEEMDKPVSFTGDLLNGKLPEPDATSKLQFLFLEQNKMKISELSYNVFKAQLLADQLSGIIYNVKNYYEQNIANGDDGSKRAFVKRFKELFYPVNTDGIDDYALAQSRDYIYRLKDLFKLNALIETGSYDPQFTYKTIIDHSSGYTRDASLLMYFLNAGNNLRMQPLYKDAGRYMLSPENLAMLKALAKRSTAYLDDYTFKDQHGKEIRISDFKNKILLIDLWFWGCGGCELYFKNVLSKFEKESFINKDVVLLSISYDSTIERWKKGLKEGVYSSDKAVNVYAGPALGYKHPLIEHHDIIWFPTQMLVDRSGKIVNFKTEDLKTYDGLMKEVRKLL